VSSASESGGHGRSLSWHDPRVVGNFISDWLILAEEMNLMELWLEPLAIEPLGSVGIVSFSDSMMTYIWFLSALVFVQAGYVGKDVESILYKLLMIQVIFEVFCMKIPINYKIYSKTLNFLLSV
jgi:hypothetical protein